MNHSFDPAAMEILLGMGKDEIRSAAASLIGRHATELQRFIAAPWDDYDLVFNADGTAAIIIRLWADMVPPFRHAIVRIELSFEEGNVVSIDTVQRKSFGA